MENKGFKILFFTSIFLVLADLVSTLLNGELVEHLEVNPLYKYGGLTLIVLMNIIIYAYFWWIYNRKKIRVSDRYFCILALTIILGFRCLAVYGNIYTAYQAPRDIMEEYNVDIMQAKEIQLNHAKTVTEAQKIEYMKQMAMPFVMPYLCTLLAWFMYKLDHNIEVKHELVAKKS